MQGLTAIDDRVEGRHSFVRYGVGQRGLELPRDTVLNDLKRSRKVSDTYADVASLLDLNHREADGQKQQVVRRTRVVLRADLKNLIVAICLQSDELLDEREETRVLASREALEDALRESLAHVDSFDLEES